jgi:glycosylphosphatidylinositol transamidase
LGEQTLTDQVLPLLFGAFAAINSVLPYIASVAIIRIFQPTAQQYQLMKSFSLLLLGMFLSSLATLNFSLALLVGLLAAPLTYIRPLPSKTTLARLLGIMLNFLAPTAVLYSGALYWKIPIGEVLKESAFGWNVWGMNTQVVVWCVWWPAWLVGSIILHGKPRDLIQEVGL